MKKYTFRIKTFDYNEHIVDVTANTLKEAWIDIVEYIGVQAQEIKIED
jgi:hypothetical protein